MGKLFRNVGLLPLIVLSLSACTDVDPEGNFFGSVQGNNALLSGLPNSVNNQSGFFPDVSSANNIQNYEYKYGLAGSTDCSDSSLYLGPWPETTAIPIGNSPHPALTTQGLYRLCVIGQDSDGVWQDHADATEWTWTYDSVAPTSNYAQAVGQPDPTNNTSIEFQYIFNEDIDVSSVAVTDFGMASGTGTINSFFAHDSRTISVYVDVTGSNITENFSISMFGGAINDLAGNPSGGVSVGDGTVLFDDIPPTISVTSPTGDIQTSGSVTITGSCEGTLALSITGDIQTPVSSFCGTGVLSESVDFTVGEGVKNITISQTDAAGNTTNFSHSITADNGIPIVDLTSKAQAGDYINIAEQPGLVLSGVCETGLMVNISGMFTGSPENVSCTAGTFNSSSLNITQTDGLAFALTVSQTDAAGNVGSESSTLTMDLTAPSPTFAQGTDGTYIGGSNVLFDVHFDENLVDVASSVALFMETGTNAVSTGITDNMLHMSYTVAAADYSADFNYSGSSLMFNNGSITDAAGNPINTVMPFSVGDYLSDRSDIELVGTVASLSLAANTTNDFGQVDTASSNALEFILTNSTNTPATITIDGFGLAAPFDFLGGGGYPGVGGSCGGTITNSSCSIFIVFAPTTASPAPAFQETDTIVVNYDNGTGADSVSLGIQGQGLFELRAVYPANAGWGDYVAKDAGDFDSSDTACLGTELGDAYESCIHSGMLRKVPVYGRASCTNLDAIDSLGVFEWVCDDAQFAFPVFYIDGFADGMGLKDLIDNTGSWELMSVDIQDTGVSIGVTDTSNWWNNSINVLPASTTASIDLNQPGRIYYHNADIETWGYTISADRVSIVSRNGAEIRSPQSAIPDDANCNDVTGLGVPPATPRNSQDIRSMFCVNGQNHLWFEVAINGVQPTHRLDQGITLNDVNNSVIWNSSVHGTRKDAGEEAIRLRSSSKNEIYDLHIHDSAMGLNLVVNSNGNIIRDIYITDVGFSGGEALAIEGSHNNHVSKAHITNIHTSSGIVYGLNVVGQYNVFEKMMITNVRSVGNSFGIYLHGTGTNENKFSEVLVANIQGRGIQIGSGSGSSFNHVTSTNNSDSAIFIQGSANGHNFNNTVFTNSQDGIEITSSAATPTSFQNTISAHHSGSALTGTGTNNSAFTGNFQVGSSDSCTAGPYTNIGSACNDGLVNRIVRDMTNAFVGYLAGDDILNPMATSSTTFGLLDTPAKWLLFDNPFRSWIRQGLAYPNNTRGFTGTGTAQIFDFRAANLDQFHQSSFSGDVTDGGTANRNGAFPDAANCFAELDGSVQVVQPATGNAYLMHAIEISFDGIGDDDTLCEQDEDCFYAPNRGAYQGEGDVYSQQCTFNADGGLSNILMFARPIDFGS